MTNAQHLIENAIMHLCRTGKLLEADVNESHCSCTLEDVNDMAQHIIWSLYNGLSPNDVDRLQEERDAAVADLETIAKKLDDPCYWCANYSDVKLTLCMMCDDEEHNGNFEWRGLQLTEKTSDKEEKE